MTNSEKTGTDALPRQVYVTATLSGRKHTHVIFAPDAAARAQIAAVLGLLNLPQLRLEGQITPEGRRDLAFRGTLTARVVQACVISLAPVTTALAEDVQRRYLTELALPDAEEAEVPDDDSVEAMPLEIDAAQIAIEALTLALPQYPRGKGAVLQETAFAAPGLEPLRDQDLRPFAGLAALVRKDGPTE